MLTICFVRCGCFVRIRPNRQRRFLVTGGKMKEAIMTGYFKFVNNRYRYRLDDRALSTHAQDFWSLNPWPAKSDIGYKRFASASTSMQV